MIIHSIREVEQQTSYRKDKNAGKARKGEKVKKIKITKHHVHTRCGTEVHYVVEGESARPTIDFGVTVWHSRTTCEDCLSGSPAIITPIKEEQDV